jgi:peptidoglycan/xylan/chitin deacetylase (PgdA/CDA1 family)
MLTKLIDLAFDRRNPLFFPLNYISKVRMRKKLRMAEFQADVEVLFFLTFDVEYDFGSAGRKTTDFLGPFLQGIHEFLKERQWPATFFVQANLLAPYQGPLKALESDGHEIGVHGWAHEPWGKAWFIKGRVPRPEEREKLLRKILEEFERNGFNCPKSFRAPEMVMDKDSFHLLSRYGIEFDSSAPSYRQVDLRMSHGGLLREVPVSTHPIPSFDRKGVASYAVLNMLHIEKFSDISESVIRYQGSSGQKPYLVFLAHSWEFDETDKFQYCTSRNYSRLQAGIDLLGKKFRLNFKTIAETGSSLPAPEN